MIETSAGNSVKPGSYPPIGDYALIGDCRGAGLVSRDGSLDWLCLPRFDSSPIFAALLDARAGGRFRIRPRGEFRAERRYLPDTNVLETTFHAPGGAFVLRDLLPVAGLALSARATTFRVRRLSSPSRRRAWMKVQAPMFSGSSCTHTRSVAFG